MSCSLRHALPCLALAAVLGASACGRDEAKPPPPTPASGPAIAQASSPSAKADSVLVPGRWRPLRRRPAPEMTPEQEAKAEQLRAIGYAGGVAPPRTNDVLTVCDRERAWPGLNFWCSGHAPIAFLMTMDGDVLHQWSADAFAIWPDLHVSDESWVTDSWRRARLLPNGDVLAIFEGIGLVKLDAASNVVWAVRNGAHHDLQVLPDGTIYVLTRTAHLVPRLQEAEPVLEDYVSVLSPDGQEKQRVSVLEAFERSDYDSVRTAKNRLKGDIFHTNTLNVIGEDVPAGAPWLQPGRILTAMRYLDCVAVLDLHTERMEYAFTGGFARLHDPRLLANGHILLFDNLGLKNHSRVMEIDPVTKDVVWQYDGEDDYPLSSYLCGAAQRLPNGNTLISETDQGRAVEVTAKGDVVWEFFNPFRVGEDPQYIATIFEMQRLPIDFPVEWASRQP